MHPINNLNNNSNEKKISILFTKCKIYLQVISLFAHKKIIKIVFFLLSSDMQQMSGNIFLHFTA